MISNFEKKIIKDDVLRFALENNLIPNDQHGFVPGRSIITNLLDCVDFWSEIWHSGSSIDVVYLVIARAFHRVPHKRLLYKLE